jgi:hypothetical protein
MAFATVRKSRGVLSGGRAASPAPAEHVPGTGRRELPSRERADNTAPSTPAHGLEHAAAPARRPSGRTDDRGQGGGVQSITERRLSLGTRGHASRPAKAEARHSQPRSAAICVSRSSPGLSPGRARAEVVHGWTASTRITERALWFGLGPAAVSGACHFGRGALVADDIPRRLVGLTGLCRFGTPCGAGDGGLAERCVTGGFIVLRRSVLVWVGDGRSPPCHR